MAKKKVATKKKITQKNFNDYTIELLSDSDSKGLTITSSNLLTEVEQKYDNESELTLAYNAIKTRCKRCEKNNSSIFITRKWCI